MLSCRRYLGSVGLLQECFDILGVQVVKEWKSAVADAVDGLDAVD